MSEVMGIMGQMKRGHHLDPALLDLFVSSRVWARYAEDYLAPEQRDEPDIAALLAVLPA